MPVKSSAENGVRQIPQFIKYRMSEDEMASYMSNETIDENGIFTFMCDCIDKRLKFSASYDSYGGGCQAFLTPGAEDDPNYGYTLSARAPDLTNAIGLLKYKHFTLFGGIWPKETEAKGSAWG